MKKKTEKKLVLAKETVRGLDGVVIRQAQGGAIINWSAQGGCIVTQTCTSINTNNETK